MTALRGIDVRLRLARLCCVTDGRRVTGDLGGFAAAVMGAGVDLVELRDDRASDTEKLSALDVLRTAALRSQGLVSVYADPELAREFGATHVVAERDEAGAAAVKALTDGIGADCVLECVGTEGARLQAVGAVRDGGNIGLVGVPHGDLPVNDLFWRNVGVKGGPAHVRAYLPHLLELVLTRTIDPGKVFDLELPLAEVAEAYAAMDERRAIKVLLRP